MSEAEEERAALTHFGILCFVLVTLWKCLDKCTYSDSCQAGVKNQAEHASILGSKPKERETGLEKYHGKCHHPFLLLDSLKKPRTHLIF